MIEILDPADRARRNYRERALQPGNATLNRRTQPNARQYVCRLGYNTACSSYTDTAEIGRLSGSSLNRMESKRRRNEREKAYKEAEEAAKKICPGTYAAQVHEARLELLRYGTFTEPKLQRKISSAPDRRGQPGHVLSKRSRGKVRDKCTALYRCFKETGILATLTFINRVSDRLAVKVLNKFLTQLRDDKGRVKYIWVAERQHKNKKYPGNIHFHIVLDRRLEVERYNELWVRQQYKSGIVYGGMSEDQAAAHLNPFDVEPIDSMYGLSYYLTKYVTKNKSDGFECLAWHCSRSVSKLFTRTVISRSTFAYVAGTANTRTWKGKQYRGKEIKGAYHLLFFIENKLVFLPEMSELEQINSWILDGMLPDRIPLIEDFEITKYQPVKLTEVENKLLNDQKEFLLKWSKN